MNYLLIITFSKCTNPLSPVKRMMYKPVGNPPAGILITDVPEETVLPYTI